MGTPWLSGRRSPAGKLRRSQAMQSVIEREMTITHKEFMRLLPRAIEDREYSSSDSTIVIGEGGECITITLSDETRRRIGGFSLPVTWVTIAFEGYSAGEQQRFLGSFDRAYLKCGG